MNGKKSKIFVSLSLLVCCVFLNGCLEKGKADGHLEDANSLELPKEISFLKDPEEGAGWKDNQVDDLHAVINLPVTKVVEKGEKKNSGGGSFFACEGGGIRFKNHACDNYYDNYSGVNGIATDGTEFTKKIDDIEPDRKSFQIHVLGPKAGEDGYVACYQISNERDGKIDSYWFYELDGNFQKVRVVQGKLNTREFIKELMQDKDGYIHLTYVRYDGKLVYVIVSRKGEQIFETVMDGRPRLCAYKGGEIAVSDEIYVQNVLSDRRFYSADVETHSLRELPVSKDETVRRKMTGYVDAATPVSEHVLAWCGSTGVLAYDDQSRETRLLYGWSNHGIKPNLVYDLTAMSDGSFGILYSDGQEDYYLLLRPTAEKEELKSITIAVSPYNRETYSDAAAIFQKRYPQYVINLKDDYDEMSLLTQLGAGDGPVLVDTEITGFENLESLWEPLDGFLEQTHLADELIPETREFGKIGGVTYGIVRDFRIETLIISDSGPSDWDYDGFLNALEGFSGAALTYKYIEFPVDWREKFFYVINNGMDDNYFFDAETGRMIFGTKEFERLLKLSDKALKCPPAEEGKALQEGKALCEHEDILALAGVIRLRRRLEANGERAIGYPTKDGARHVLAANAPVAMRSTATAEEKEIAYTFLKVMLSEEAMSGPHNMTFSVRKDVMEQQFKEYERNVAVMKEIGTYDPDYAPELDWDGDVNFFEEMIRRSTVRKKFPTGLQKVFDEEVGDYLAGRIDGRALDDHLKNRVWLYLEESR